jgi:DHA1 family bicyclomycin/chloramphenicol resistance-like MFS transporter
VREQGSGVVQDARVTAPGDDLPEEPDHPETPLRLRGSLLATLAALSAFGPISLDLYLPAFPSIAESLGVSTGDVQMTFAACLLGLGVGQLLYGPLSDRYGRKPPLIAGLILYIVASLLCAVAPSLAVLTGLRLVQGLGGCAGLVIARAIVRDCFDGPALARSYSVITSVAMLAPLISPTIGALVLRAVGWREVFLVIALFGAACLVGTLMLPETHPSHRRSDHGVQAALRGYGSLLRRRDFVLPGGVAALASGTLMAYISSSSVVFITDYDVTPLGFALIFALMSLFFVSGVRLNLHLLQRRTAHSLLRIYLPVIASGMAVTLVLLVVHAPLWSVLLALAVVKVCLGGTLPNATAEAMLPFARRAGAASALLGTLQMGLGAVIAALLALLPWPPTVEMAGTMLVLSLGASALVALPPAAAADPGRAAPAPA